jgi:PAS domain S-box-containing protein
MKNPISQDEKLKSIGLFSFAENFSLKGRLLLWIMPIIILGLLSLSFAAYTSINIVIETELSNSMLMSVGKSAESINRWLATIMIEPETIASTPAAKQINQNFQSFDLQNINRHKILHKNHPDIFQDIYAANREGEYHTILQAGGKYTVFVGDIENRPYFRSIMAGGNTQITPPLISRTTGIPTIFMVAPILDDNNTPQGLIGAGISLKYIQQIAQELKAGKTGYGFIIAKDGTFIYHPNNDFVMQQKITEHENPSKKALGKFMVSGDSGTYRYSQGHERMVAFYQPIPITGWAVATVLPETELFAPAIKMIKLLISITILFAGLIAAAILYTMQRLTNPLQMLALKTHQIAAGNFTGHLTVRSNDEIGSLSKSFNEMIDGLESQKIEVKNLVNKLRKTVKDLIKAKTYTANIIDSMPSILIGIDHHLNITQWNKAAEEATGVRAADAKGKSVTSIWLRPGIDIETISQSIENRKTKNLPKIARIFENDTFHDDITIFPLITDDTKDAVIRIDDVTEKIKMEELLIQSEKMLSVGGLAAGMAHEINNPLAGIMQTASVISNRITNIELPANKKVAEKLGITMDTIHQFMELRGIPKMICTMNEAGQRVSEIVNNMLSFARKSDAQFSSHSITELINTTLELSVADYDLKKKYDFRNIEIIKNYDESIPLVPCEGGKIQQVLLNIFRNGAQAMQDINKPQFIIHTWFDEGTKMVCIDIKDNGPGMDEKTRKRIFEPFFTTKPVGIGTGLGLSVSYFIITENHNGTMDVFSEPGKGTKFTIRLPLYR